MGAVQRRGPGVQLRLRGRLQHVLLVLVASRSMATVDLTALRELVSELVTRHGDPEWIVRLGDITAEAPASFALDIDSG